MPRILDLTNPTHHVLITGYGPFANIADNLSWRAVAPLHNTHINTPSATIHVTALGPLKVAYSTVLALLPGLHARPPTLPPPTSLDAPSPVPAVPPPADGYDLTFHLGAGPNGALSLEQVGHKSGYHSPDVDDELAPVIAGAAHAKAQEPSAAERFETERLGQHVSTSGDGAAAPQRGFGEGYERFPEELHTEVDVPGLIEHLKQQGETRVVASTDAGHFLCDFICYGSLAESQRSLFEPGPDESHKPVWERTTIKRSKSLFMHVPYDEHKPHSVGELTEAVRQVVAWVCVKERALPV